MRVVLIGANGQLGSDLTVALVDAVDLRPLTHAQVDIADAASVSHVLAQHAPDLVVNTAAFNRVDDCEVLPDLALRVNASGPHLLADACRVSGAVLLHISTDYVFSGVSSCPWTEADVPRPISMYGISKYAGELAVRAACPASYIVRVSGLFGLKGSRGKGGNFVQTMLRLQAERRPIRVVDDQVLAPTYTADLAAKLCELVLAQPPFGTYHVTAAGACSWYAFAQEIFDLAGLEVDLTPQSTAAASLRARRPAYSVLANDALASCGISQIRPWAEGLGAYLAQCIERDRSASAVGA